MNYVNAKLSGSWVISQGRLRRWLDELTWGADLSETESWLSEFPCEEELTLVVGAPPLTDAGGLATTRVTRLPTGFSRSSVTVCVWPTVETSLSSTWNVKIMMQQFRHWERLLIPKHAAAPAQMTINSNRCNDGGSVINILHFIESACWQDSVIGYITSPTTIATIQRSQINHLYLEILK